MIYKKVDLKKKYNLKYSAILEIFSLETTDWSKRELAPCALVLAGGGYAFVSNREKDPVAIAFSKEGFISATLTYTVVKKDEDFPLYPNPQLEVLAAIDYLRKHYKKYRIDKDKITLVGFSAGGHLAASVSYLYKDKELLNTLCLTKENVKPNYLVLGYPVITMYEGTHGGSRNLISNHDEKLYEKLSIEKNIKKDFPPTFIWNTLEDQSVPTINVTLMTEALKKAGVKYKCIQYEYGWHGLSLIDRNTVLDENERKKYQENSAWFNECINFLYSLMTK